MDKKSMASLAIAVTLCCIGVASAAERTAEDSRVEKKTSVANPARNKVPAPEKQEAPPSGGSQGTQDAASVITATSKKQHDTATKIIDNLK